MSRSRHLLPPLLVALLAAAPADAQLFYVALGDSHTAGIGDSQDPPAGYPPRLQKLLRQEGFEGAVVSNLGVPGETSSEGLSRIGAALNGSPDAILLLYGANDVVQIEQGVISAETVLDNLDRMAKTARARGVEPVHTTLLPRRTRVGADRDNRITIDLVFSIRKLAIDTGRGLTDIWEAYDITNDPDSFETLYADIARDPVGHPNPEGYDRIAELFRDVLLERDTVKPVPGGLFPGFDTFEIPRDQEFRVVLYEPRRASGLDLKNSFLTLNGRVVAEPDPQLSNRRRAVFVFGDPDAVGCRAELGVRAADRSDPPNVIERTLRIYDVRGRKVLRGDVDFDCRVDGFDLVAFALRFGTRQGDEGYAGRFDLDADGRIDGEDLAILGANFGKDSG